MKALLNCTVVVAAVAAQAEATTIQIERSFRFVEHTRVFDDFTVPTTIFTDVYEFDAVPVVLPSDTYDAIELTLSPENGQRLVVDASQFSFGVLFNSDLTWIMPPLGGSLTTGGHSFSYLNGAGDLPTPVGGSYGLSSTGTFLNSRGGFSFVNGSFAFDAVTISDAFNEVNASGTLEPQNFRLTITGTVLGDVPDIGRFTFFVPEPPSAALLGLGLLIVTRRRTCPTMKAMMKMS
ncbi:MAG: PEP-CTERM sorting domain-containing protein [Planctomycetota bacterium]